MNAHGTAALTRYRFDCTGRSGQYFRIWVVSLFLSVVTLGIYSAWGKVRKKRYLYSHTELDGTRFEFRAAPLAILRGRVIALVLLGGFALSGHVLPIMQLVFIIILLVFSLQVHAKEESGSLLQYLSTHPATEEQIQRAEQQR